MRKIPAVEGKAQSTLKAILFNVIGLAIMGAMLVGVVFLLRGMVWVSDKIYPWLLKISEIVFDVCVLVLLPLCIFRKLRPWCGVGFVYSSYIFGILLWAFSCLFVVDVWGYFALVVGLLLAGVGVVPVALLASVIRGEWSVFGNVLFGIVLAFGIRYFGLWLATPKEEKRKDVFYECDEEDKLQIEANSTETPTNM